MPHRIAVRSRFFLHRNYIAQMAFLTVFWLLGELVARLLHLPIPGAIIGLALVLILLATGRVSLFSVNRGANWLLAEMLLFFVPAVLALLDHHEFFGWLGLKILVVILASTVVVMAITALTIDLCYLWMSKHGRS